MLDGFTPVVTGSGASLYEFDAELILYYWLPRLNFICLRLIISGVKIRIGY